jgi:phosphatidate cytidylyltransferase
MLAGILVNRWSFLLLFSVIHFGCWLEYQKLIGIIKPEYQEIKPLHKYGVMAVGWFFMLFMTSDAFQIANLPLYKIGRLLLLVSGVVLPLFVIVVQKKLSVQSLTYSLIGLIYISLSFGLLMDLRSMGIQSYGSYVSADNGRIVPAILIASIWVNDTMQYVVGSLIGKTPFSKISPKKTWEGTIGGAILCVAAVTLGGYYLFKIDEIAALIVISTIAAVLGTIGDLFESGIKRRAGVKDSGDIMPGHGGFLDRFDSLLFAIPFVWLYIVLLT